MKEAASADKWAGRSNELRPLKARTALRISCMLPRLKGCLPTSSTYVSTPTAHTSMDVLHGRPPVFALLSVPVLCLLSSSLKLSMLFRPRLPRLPSPPPPGPSLRNPCCALPLLRWLPCVSVRWYVLPLFTARLSSCAAELGLLLTPRPCAASSPSTASQLYRPALPPLWLLLSCSAPWIRLPPPLA